MSLPIRVDAYSGFKANRHIAPKVTHVLPTGRRSLPTSFLLDCPMEPPCPKIENGVEHSTFLLLVVPRELGVCDRVPFFNGPDGKKNPRKLPRGEKVG